MAACAKPRSCWVSDLLTCFNFRILKRPQILEREFLAPYGITQTDLATHTGWTRKHVNQLCRGRVPVTVDSAFILAAATRTEPEYWLGLQSAVDLWDAENDEALRSRLGQVRPLAA
ncbi:TPA: HigA family addiction module antitoxin [Klebsiella variicola]